MVEIWSVITTHNRHSMLHGLLECLDRDRTVVIDHASTPPVKVNCAQLIRVDGPLNLSALWNLGLDTVAELAPPGYAVAVLNDDLLLPEGTLERLAEAVVAEGASIAFPDVFGHLAAGEVQVRRGQPGPHNLYTRMTGFCFLLAPGCPLRLDEELAFWYGDDDLEWRAIAENGTVRVGGLALQHLAPNEAVGNPALAEQAGKDRDTFIAKWGQPPW